MAAPVFSMGTRLKMGFVAFHYWRPCVLGFALSLTLAVAACGSTSPARIGTTAPGTGGSSCPGGTGATGAMSAKINGVSWTAACLTASVFVNGAVSFGGSDSATGSTNEQNIEIGATASGPGTYPIGPPPANTNGTNALLTIGGTQVWEANATQGSGSITFTTLSATGATGTFFFDLAADPPATGTKMITDGVFAITF